jgi:polyphosphate kinase
MAPIKDAAAQVRIREVLAVMGRDDRRAWTLGPDATWRRVEPSDGGEPTIDTFEVLMRAATERLRDTP